MASVPACLLNVLPVIHPPHLDGDPTLATEILPGPPSLESIRQLSKKNEPRKIATPSYLPLSDPGTTYTGFAGGMASMGPDEIGPRRKRARMDKGLSNRAQRASARHLVGSTTLNDRASISEVDAASSHLDLDDIAAFNDEDRSTSHSSSTSIPLNGETHGQTASADGTRTMNGKGKGKETEKSEKVTQVRVKEEPVVLQLSDIPTAPTNEDHCSSCSSVGALVYCDGCPRAFHLWCLDPPMDPSNFPEGEESWYCPSCKIDQGPPAKPSHTFLSPLIQQLQNTIPTEFRLPEAIRSFFRDVGTGPGGTYMDNSSVKAVRIGRHGLGEERDPYRLKDNKGAPVICFQCGKSALPDDPASSPSTKRPRRASTVLSQLDHWKSLISCDFCPLHWHVDCLDPPMASLPPLHRKWKCPNHASSSAPKLRTPRATATPIDITETSQRNNGNIEVINSEMPSRPEEKMSVDEVLINGRKYRVPERIIVLDFWGKVKQQRTSRLRENISTASSPLTPLSSLDDQSDHPPHLKLNDRLLDSDDDSLQVAGLLCRLQSGHPILQLQSRLIRKDVQAEQHELVQLERQNTKRINTHIAATVVKNLERKQRNHRNEQVAIRLNRPAIQESTSSSKSPSKKSGINGVRPLRSAHAAVSHTTSHHGSKTKKSISSVTGAQPLHGPRANQPTPTRNGKRVTGSEGLFVRSSLTNEAAEPKPSVSPLKIRIPSRLLQKQSNSSVSAGDSARAPSSVSSLQARPRRSLRRQASMNGTCSERSISIDRGHEGRS